MLKQVYVADNQRTTQLSRIKKVTVISFVAIVVTIGVSYFATQLVSDSLLTNSLISSEQLAQEIKPVIKVAHASATGNSENVLAKSNPLPLDSGTSLNPQPVNGISVNLIGTNYSDGYLQASVCFQLPSEDDWLLGSSAEDVTLLIGEKRVPIWGFKLIDWKQSAAGNKTHRCDQLYFPVSADEISQPFTITINKLATSIPEHPDCEKAQAKLNSARTGIVIKCKTNTNGGGFEITQKPASIENVQATKLVQEAFSETINGPWVIDAKLP